MNVSGLKKNPVTATISALLVFILTLTPSVPLVLAETANPENIIVIPGYTMPVRSATNNTSTQVFELPTGSINEIGPLSQVPVQPFQTSISTSPAGVKNLSVQVEASGKAKVTWNVLQGEGQWDAATNTLKIQNVKSGKDTYQTWTIKFEKENETYRISQFEVETNRLLLPDYQYDEIYQFSSDQKLSSRVSLSSYGSSESFSRIDYVYSGNQWLQNTIGAYKSAGLANAGMSVGAGNIGETYTFHYTLTEKTDKYWIRTHDYGTLSGNTGAEFFNKIKNSLNGEANYALIKAAVGNGNPLKSVAYHESFPTNSVPWTYLVDFFQGVPRALYDPKNSGFVGIIENAAAATPETFDPKTAKTTLLQRSQQVKVGEVTYQIYWGAYYNSVKPVSSDQMPGQMDYGLIFSPLSNTLNSGPSLSLAVSTGTVVHYPFETKVTLNGIAYNIQISLAGKLSLVPVTPNPEPKPPVIQITSQVPALTNKTTLEVAYTVDGLAQTKIFQLIEGNNELLVEAKNQAGLMSQVKLNVTRDTIAPKIEVMSSIPAETVAASIAIEYFVEGVRKQKNFELTLGENMLKLDETDLAGNKTHWEQKVTRKETPAPVINVISEVPTLTNKVTLQVSYRVDGGAIQTKTFNLVEGDNSLVIEAENVYGKKSEVRLSVRRDTIAPSIQVMTLIPAETVESSLLITYKVDGVQKQKTFELTLGENTLKLDETDLAGNKTHWEQKVTRKETPAPVINVISEVPTLTNKTTLEVQYRVDGGAIQTKSFNLVEGDNSLVIEAENVYGKKSEVRLSVKRDTIAPSIQVMTVIPAETVETSILVMYKVDGVEKQKTFALVLGENTIKIDEADLAGNTAHFEQKITRKEPVYPNPVITIIDQGPALTNQATLTVTYRVDNGAMQTKTFNLVEGLNEIIVEAENVHGNKSQVKWNVTRDTIAPSIQVMTVIPAETVETSILVMYRVDGVEKQKTFALVLGENTIKIDEADLAGNAAHFEQKITRKEPVYPNPVITIVSQGPALTNQTTLTVTYKVDGGALQSKTFNLVEGLNEIIVEAENVHGNKSQVKWNVTRDTIAPAIEILTDISEETEEASLTVNYKVDGVEKQKTFVLVLGDNTLVIIETDMAGNQTHLELRIMRNESADPEPGEGLPPVFSAIPNKTIVASSALQPDATLTLAATDPEGGAITYLIKSVTKEGVLIPRVGAMQLNAITGVFSYSLQPADFGNYVITFAAKDADNNETLQTMSLEVKKPDYCEGWMMTSNPVCIFLRANNAAGNIGDYYVNQDGGHANLSLVHFTQVSLPTPGYPTQGVIVANASVASASPCGSVPCSQLSSIASQLYQRYRNNSINWHPEHRDHDTVDYFTANSPYIGTSQGSSTSEIDEVKKFFWTLAGFKPEVKQKLKETGLLMPVVQMIFRLARVNGDEQRYLSGEAHPTVFDNNENTLAMVQMANSITLDSIPAFAMLKVEEETFSSDPSKNSDQKSEIAFDTPAAISRIFRGTEYTHSMTLSAEESFDVNGKPLVYEWRVLRGDAEHVRITKLNESGSRVRIEFDYQGEHLGAGSAIGSTIPSNRMDVGLFVKSGDFWSPPAFVSVYTPRNENRIYENGVLKEVTYTDALQSAHVGYPKNWLKDVYHADGSWTRTMLNNSTVDFTPEGHQVLSKDIFGRILTAREVTYALTPTGTPKRWAFTANGARFSYGYTGEEDTEGHLAYADVLDGSNNLLNRARMIYDEQGDLKEVRVESNQGVLLSVLSELTPKSAKLSLPDGSKGVRVQSVWGWKALISNAASLASVIPIMHRTIELLAAQNGKPVSAYEFSGGNLTASPEVEPNQNYLGNFSMLIVDTTAVDKSRQNMVAYSWTNRPYPAADYPGYPENQGYHIVIGSSWPYTFYDFTPDGDLMGTHQSVDNYPKDTDGGSNDGPRVAQVVTNDAAGN